MPKDIDFDESQQEIDANILLLIGRISDYTDYDRSFMTRLHTPLPIDHEQWKGSGKRKMKKVS